MDVVKPGDKVSIRYTGKLKDGYVFDSTDGRDAFEFVAGSPDVIQGISQAVIGMAIGQKKQIAVAPEHGFGRRNPDLVSEVPRSLLPHDAKLSVGTFLRISNALKQTYVARVQEIREKTLLIDVNHPLADRTLLFDLELISFSRVTSKTRPHTEKPGTAL